MQDIKTPIGVGKLKSFNSGKVIVEMDWSYLVEFNAKDCDFNRRHLDGVMHKSGRNILRRVHRMIFHCFFCYII